MYIHFICCLSVMTAVFVSQMVLANILLSFFSAPNEREKEQEAQEGTEQGNNSREE